MSEMIGSIGLEVARRESGVKRNLLKARSYMSEHGGKLRFDIGIGIWFGAKKMDKEVMNGNHGLISDLTALMGRSDELSDDGVMFSNLATRELQVSQKNIEAWDLEMVRNVFLIEDLGEAGDRDKVREIFQKNKTKITEILSKRYENGQGIKDVVDMGFETISERKKYSPILVEDRIKELTCGLGLEAGIENDCVKSWMTLDFISIIKEGGIDSGYAEIKNTVQQNLICLQELKERVGMEGIKILHDEYGVTNFGRYPAEILIKQLNDENINRPYGVWLGAYADWNGAFMSSGDKNNVKNVCKDADNLGFGLKIIEARDKMSIVKRIVTLDRKFGKDNKISFVVINGHGNANFVLLGKNQSDTLTSDDLKKESAGKMRKYYAKKVPFLFNSCSTGQEIGPEYSRFGNSYSMAPDRPGSIGRIILKKDTQGDLFFDGQYISSDDDGSESVIFKNGDDFKEGLVKENDVLYEKDYQEMLKDKKAMTSVWSDGGNVSLSILLDILKRERLDPLKKTLREEFGNETSIELETGMGGSGDDGEKEQYYKLVMDLSKEDSDYDWGTGFIENLGRGCRFTYAQLGEKKKTSWPEVRVIKKEVGESKKIIARYKVDMSDFWPENIK